MDTGAPAAGDQGAGDGGDGLEVLHERCAGLDVHKKTVVACVLRPRGGGRGGAPVRVTQTFSTMTAGLERLGDWLAGQGVTHVALEATGVYWKPVWNVLEAQGRFALVLVNAEHFRQAPGRKTDVKDAEWLATLLRHGLLRGSFVPDRAQRELRELTRYRTALIRERAAEVNRLQKTLEGANLKLAAVLTDLTGASGRAILDALLAGETDPAALAALAHWRVLRHKRDALTQAVAGRLDPGGALHFVVTQQLAHLHALDAQLEACDAKVAEVLRPFAAELAALDRIPGVGARTAQILVAEVGTDMGRFPSHRHLAAWAGMAPGNRESGGKRYPARARKGSPWLRAALAECAWAASKARAGYLPAQFRRLAARRGTKRAIVAVGHSILVIAYHVLKEGTVYEDLGGTYFDARDRKAVSRRLVRRLEALGLTVHVEPTAATPAAA
jgi:transposase